MMFGPKSGGEIRIKDNATERSTWLLRVVDLHGGRILLLALSLFKTRPRLPDDIRNVGLLTFGAIGDAIVASAIVSDIKLRYPNARVTMVVSKTNQGAMPMLHQIDGFVVLPLFNPASAIRTLRKRKFDLLIDANQWLRISAVYCALAGVPHTIGFRTAGQYRHYSYSWAVDHLRTRHELDNFRALLEPLGIVGKELPRVIVDDTARRRAMRAMPTKPFVVIHPWAGGGRAELKQWPDRMWIELADLLSQRGFAIVASGAPADAVRTRRMADAAREADVAITPLAGRFHLVETAALLSEARFVVAVNTGIAHLAAALGKPVIVLHGPTNPLRWGPLGPASIALVPDAPAGLPVGYLNLGFEFPPNAAACMEFISVADVMSAVRKAGLFAGPDELDYVGACPERRGDHLPVAHARSPP